MRRVWNNWGWLKWTPLPFFLVVFGLGNLTPEEGDQLLLIGYIWLGVAVASTTVAVLLAFKTHRVKCVAIAELPPDDPFRMLMEIQHATTVLTVAVHLVFTAVGAAIVFLPEATWRILGSRAALVDAQYMLFLIVVLTYAAVLLVMRKMREAVNEENLHPKSKEVMDKNLRRGRM